jgi:putative phosphoribosyl transferase
LGESFEQQRLRNMPNYFEIQGMIFADRTEAGRKLANRLTGYANRDDVMVLGIPRGGVAVAFEVAARLHAPLDVFLLRKLGVPGQEELAFGAIASGGVRVLDRDIIEAMGISEKEIELVTAKERQELRRREQVYRGERAALDVHGKTEIVEDDGVATGSSMFAGIEALRQLQPARMVVAVPVAPARTCKRLNDEVDEVVCLKTPDSFHAIGQFYENFSQVGDEEVIALLNHAELHELKEAG